MDESQSIHSDITPASSAEHVADAAEEASADGISRRQALRRMAAFGATLAWAAPAVQRLGMAPAHAQTNNGTPKPCECLEEAYALKVLATGLVKIDTTVAKAPDEGDPCVADVNLSLGTAGHVKATTLCSNTQECHATASVATLDVLFHGLKVDATVLTAEADADANDDGTGDCPPQKTSSLATLIVKLNGIALAVSSAPNTTIHITDPLGVVSGTIVINEQGDTCETVSGVERKRVFANALRINVAALGQTLEVIASHVAVTSCCPC